MSLFQICNITLNSGQTSNFKIECDFLTREDWECLALLTSERLKFRKVVSVPTGGDMFAECLQKYVTDDDSLPILVCDDVLTTGGSMERKKVELLYQTQGLPGVEEDEIIGIVAFARGECPDWITTLFELK